MQAHDRYHGIYMVELLRSLVKTRLEWHHPLPLFYLRAHTAIVIAMQSLVYALLVPVLQDLFVLSLASGFT